MKRYIWLWGVLLALCSTVVMTAEARAGCVVEYPSTVQADGTNLRDDKCDENGNKYTTTRLNETLAGEAVADDVLKVETRGVPIRHIGATGLTLKSGFGHLNSITCTSDAAATAGSLTLYDNTAASGPVLHIWTIPAAYVAPYTLPVNWTFNVGLHAIFATTTDVECTFSVR